MRRIVPEVLRSEREKKGWTLVDLKKRSGIDRQTIHRIESGKSPKNRDNVVEKLARALGTSEDVLTGAAEHSLPEKELDEVDELISSSQVNLRISNQARNALSLTANRYDVTLAQIVEIAPLLFCWAAERSLRQRRERLAAIDNANHELEQLRPPYLHAAAFANQRSGNPLHAERQSAEKNDLFGKLIGGDAYEPYLPDDYAEATENPFAIFLRELTGELGDLANFEEWEPNFSPKYTVCRLKVVEYVAGDNEAADEILDGSVPLHKLPKELRGNDKGEARAKWVRDEAAARLKKRVGDVSITDLGI